MGGSITAVGDTLGRSAMAREFGIADAEEAAAYAAHPVLGLRLVD